MKKVLFSLAIANALFGSEVVLESLDVTSTKIEDIQDSSKSTTEVSSAISRQNPSVDLSKRGATSSDIFIRGLKRDNISVDIDGAKIYGAGPNRMDPPISHISNEYIGDIVITNGPFDVSNYGVLGGGVKVVTKEPKKGFAYDVDITGGSFSYKKLSATVSGGSERLRVFISGNYTDMDQYKDGNGNTLSQQTEQNSDSKFHYKDSSLKAFTKKNFFIKTVFDITNNQTLKLSYLANRDSDVLYPNTPMDGIYANSDTYNISYNIKNISDIYKNLKLQFFSADARHLMSNRYRKQSNMMYMKHLVSSKNYAFKLVNDFDFFKLGLESGKRNWDGEYSATNKSIDNVDTTYNSIYIKTDKSFGSLKVDVGFRYDNSKTNPKSDTSLKKRKFDSISYNITANYAIDSINSVFVGFGSAQRVPDARELYFKKSGNIIGNQNLNQTTNYEADLGYKLSSDDADLNIKTFYNDIKNYIYINSSKTSSKFENVDAYIYGIELAGTYYINDEVSFDFIAAYKKGQKKKALDGQNDKDLADITPLNGTADVVYEYKPNSYVKLEVEARDKWRNYDSDNGEQAISGWAVANLELKHSFNRYISFLGGVENILDKTYQRSNTYADLTLISTGGTKYTLLNEMGRYIYASFDFKY